MLSTLSKLQYRFSSTAIASRTFAKFQEKYSAHLEAFKSKANESEKTRQVIKRTTQKAYTHPYLDEQHKPYYSHIDTLQSIWELTGVEQVSSHYENFGMARKDALIFWAGLSVFYFFSTFPDTFVFARTAFNAWLMFFGANYFYMQGKNSIFIPLLLRFYRKITLMEMRNLETYYAENIEARIRELMNTAKAQIDYKELHNEYLSVRNNTILHFLINEQVSVKNHLYERAQNILKQAETLEAMNHSKIINEVMAETLNSVSRAYDENKEQIEADMFLLALEGVAKGKMDYSKDPILPYAIKTIQKTIEKLNAASPEDQKRMYTLQPEQIQTIRTSDHRLRDEFLQNEPKIDGSLKNHETISKILSRWGKQAK